MCTYVYGVVDGSDMFICQLFLLFFVKFSSPQGVLMLLFNFKQLGVIFCLRHLRMNILWLLKLAIFLLLGVPKFSKWWNFPFQTQFSIKTWMVSHSVFNSVYDTMSGFSINRINLLWDPQDFAKSSTLASSGVKEKCFSHPTWCYCCGQFYSQ